MNFIAKRSLPLMLGCALGSAWGNPAGPTVVNGSALVSNPSASVLQVVNTPGTIINWQSFSIGNAQTTRFVQSNAASAVLNRDLGGLRSDILGRLESNGRVFLINPNGILFGGSSVVDVAGLIASTRDISNANFLAGNYLFQGSGAGDITVQSGASITTATYSPSGGQVWLLARNLTQEAGSTITVPQGQVVLAAGNDVLVGQNSLGQMTFAVNTSGGETIESLGTIAADRGAVGLFADIVNHRGTINAPSGSVYLHGGNRVEVSPQATINANGADGRITFRSNDVRVYPSGRVRAVDGQVTFDQYQPSQYSTGSVQVPVAERTGSGAYSFHAVSLLDDSHYAVRLISGSINVEEMILSPSGALISGPTVISSHGTLQSALAGATAGFDTYFGGLVFSLTGPHRVPTASGGAIEREFDQNLQGHILRFLASNGSVLATQSGLAVTWGSVAPLADGTVVAQRVDSAANPIVFERIRFTGAGTQIGTPTPLDAFSFASGVLYPTIAGGFTWVTNSVQNVSHVRNVVTQTFSKVVAPYSPSGAPVVGQAGAAAAFATTPGVASGSDAPPPPPPPPPSPGGVTFGGVAGCNSAVCAEDVRAAVAVTSAITAAQDVGSGPIGGDAAARAVAALAEARAANASVSGNAEAALVLRDYGELGRLQGEVKAALEASPGSASEIAAGYEAALQRFLDRETIIQQLGVSRTNPGEMTVVDAVLNMSPEERRAFAQNIADRQLVGSD